MIKDVIQRHYIFIIKIILIIEGFFLPSFSENKRLFEEKYQKSHTQSPNLIISFYLFFLSKSRFILFYFTGACAFML